MNKPLSKAKSWLQGLSFRTGITIAAICAICYTISFAQMLLPISAVAKGVLWATFYGLAKATQYTAIIILGKEGISRVRRFFRRQI